MTTFNAASLVRPHLADLEEYTPILPFEALSRKLGMDASQIVKLDANENPWGPLPAVREALAAYPYYHIYPDPQQEELRDALAEFTTVPRDHILPTHGADEMLDYLCRIFLGANDAIINCPPTFGMYEFDAGLANAQVISVARQDGFAVDVEAIEHVVRAAQSEGKRVPKLLFLTAPNNPTGNWMPDEEVLRLLKLPLLVVLDEAYVEFADHPSRALWVLEHDNLVVLRTFSKAAGIAGLRLGYGICPLWLMSLLWTFKQPYNVNVAATVAALASLRYGAEMLAVVEKMKRERARLFALLEDVAYLQAHPSQANFILCDVVARDAHTLKLALEQRGVLVRHYNKPGLRNCIRISVGQPAHTDRLLQVLREVA